MILNKKVLLLSVLGCAVIAAIVVGIVYGIVLNKKEVPKLGKGAIVSNGFECPAIGAMIHEKGGSTADVAIATLLCEGITCPQSGGLGGGFLLTLYIKEKGTIETLDAREMAPKLATKHMFDNDLKASLEGGLAVAVPGELKGMWELHQKYGKLPWKDLFEPNIELCRKGHLVNGYFGESLQNREAQLMAEPSLREVFINPETNRAWVNGDLVKRNKLADSLEVMANEGAAGFYNGSLTKTFLDDIKRFGGIISAEDLLDYQVVWGEPEVSYLKDNHTLYTSTLPGTGAVLTYILNILKGYDLKKDTLSYHRIIEAFKFAYGRRSLLGTEKSEANLALVGILTSQEFADYTRSQIDDTKTFNDYEHYGAQFEQVEDHGTANICFMAPNGDAFVATSTINYVYGSFRSSIGLILNNEMDDFAVPGRANVYGLKPSPANYIIPGNRPLSSMTPTIILDENKNVRMLIGGAGGTRITTGVAFTIINHLMFGETLRYSFDTSRIHHQLTPMELEYEKGFDMSIIKELNEKFNHTVKISTSHASVTSIAMYNDTVETLVDPRRGGNYIVF